MTDNILQFRHSKISYDLNSFKSKEGGIGRRVLIIKDSCAITSVFCCCQMSPACFNVTLEEDESPVNLTCSDDTCDHYVSTLGHTGDYIVGCYLLFISKSRRIFHAQSGDVRFIFLTFLSLPQSFSLNFFFLPLTHTQVRACKITYALVT